jgi:hypothetical protein
MKRAVILFALIASACSAESTIPAPTPLLNSSTTSSSAAGTANGFIWILAVDATGRCVDDATAEVIAGQRSGDTLKQDTPCDAWSYDGGFLFRGLAPNEPMTIRVSAPFRVAAERTLTPQVGAIMATVIELAQKQ